MYINFELFKGLEPQDLYYILAVKQIEKGVLLEIPDDTIKRLDDNGFLSLIRGSKSESEVLKMRLSSKGKKFLDDLETPQATAESLKIFEWIKAVYLANGKDLGNQKRTKTYIASFSAESGIFRNHLAFLIQSFVNDEREMEWSKVLQYLFFKSDNMYSTRFDLHSSRLYQYYLKNQQFFDNKFIELDKDN